MSSSVGRLSLQLGLATLVATAAAPAALAEKYAAIVVDADTGEVLHARHADALRYPASLTKVMTLYMVFEELEAGRLTLDQKLVVSRNAANASPSRLGLTPGSTLTVRDAIDALVTKSANDAAVVLAEKIGGSERRFAQLMTSKAVLLGLEKTTFRNASGLPNTRQQSTARDMARLANAVMSDFPDYYHYFATRSFAYGGRTYKNHNELLGKVEGVDGIKTGYTRASGFNLMASAERNDRRVIAVVMGGRTAKSRNAHVEALIEDAFKTIQANDAKSPVYAGRGSGGIISVNSAATPVLNGEPFAAPSAAPTAIEAAADLKAVSVSETELAAVLAPSLKPRAVSVLTVVSAAPTPSLKPSHRVTAPSVKPDADAADAAAPPAPAPAPADTYAPEPKVLSIAAPATPSPSSKPVGIASMARRMPLKTGATPPMTISEYEAAQFRK